MVPGLLLGGIGADAPQVPQRIEGDGRLKQASGVGVTGTVQNGSCGPGLLYMSLVEHHGVPTQGPGQPHVVGDHQKGGAQVVPQRLYDRAHGGAGLWVQAGGGFVQQHQLRV